MIGLLSFLIVLDFFFHFTICDTLQYKSMIFFLFFLFCLTDPQYIYLSLHCILRLDINATWFHNISCTVLSFGEYAIVLGH